jgi:hypothetical protein
MARRPTPRTASGWVAGAILLSAFATTRAAHADEPVPSETNNSPYAYPPPHAQPNLILIGAGVTVGWYGAAFGLSYLWPNSPGASAMRIPVAGPYMALAKTGCGSGEPDCGTFTLVLRTVLTSLAAVGQTGGVLAMVEGLFLPTATPGERAPPKRQARRTQFQISPLAPASFQTGTGAPAGLAPLGVTVSGNF